MQTKLLFTQQRKNSIKKNYQAIREDKWKWTEVSCKPQATGHSLPAVSFLSAALWDQHVDYWVWPDLRHSSGLWYLTLDLSVESAWLTDEPSGWLWCPGFWNAQIGPGPWCVFVGAYLILMVSIWTILRGLPTEPAPQLDLTGSSILLVLPQVAILIGVYSRHSKTYPPVPSPVLLVPKRPGWVTSKPVTDLNLQMSLLSP